MIKIPKKCQALLFSVIKKAIQPVCLSPLLMPLFFILLWPWAPNLNNDDQINSTLHFMRELNRLGITSIVDAGGGFQNYPEDYAIIDELNQENKLSRENRL